MLKVLVTYVPAGSGHQRAADGIFAALQRAGGQVEPERVDALNGCDSCYRWSFDRGYLDLIQRAPAVWGLSYHLTDLRAFRRGIQRLHRLNNAWHAAGLGRFFAEAKADWIIGTHFLPMEVAGSLKVRGKISSRLISVITDYRPHTLWIAPGIDLYAVASERTKEELIQRGVPEERIRVTGIPVDPRFTASLDRESLRRRFELKQDRFTILVGSGGAGTGPIQRLVRLLGRIPKPIQLIVVAGRNDALVRELEGLRPQMPHPMKVCGFVNNMEELMEVSDLLISKPGGLTCAEGMAKGLPFLLIEPIPGQESRNAAALVQMGAAALASRLEEVPEQVQAFLRDPERLRRLSQKAREIGRPDAAEKIARMALE